LSGELHARLAEFYQGKSAPGFAAGTERFGDGRCRARGVLTDLARIDGWGGRLTPGPWRNVNYWMTFRFGLNCRGNRSLRSRGKGFRITAPADADGVFAGLVVYRGELNGLGRVRREKRFLKGISFPVGTPCSSLNTQLI